MSEGVKCDEGMTMLNMKKMKTMMSAKRVMTVMMIMLGSILTVAQSKTTDQRMQQDLEVAENILGTLLRQELGRRNFFPVEVKGNYVPGYGVTFRLPLGSGLNRIMIGGYESMPATVNISPGGYSYSYSREEERRGAEESRANAEESRADAEVKRERNQVIAKTARAPKAARIEDDSTAAVAQKRFMDVSKSFLADYGDVISGLKADERIVITNRGEDFDGDFEMMWINGRESKRNQMSVEAKRSDIEQLKQGKISRTDFMGRLKVVNTQTVESLDPDLEVLASMFARLYREDLSKTYYVQGNLNYERLKDFGVMYYMKVYSSIEGDNNQFAMPTLAMRDVPQAERDKKVKELYPKFESELKENIVDYGRTLRTLKDEEQLVFTVRLTKCEACGIPASIELSIKSSALKDYSSGKATKEATLAKINVKKTGVQ